MGSAPKQPSPPAICWKWPWDAAAQTRHSTSPCDSSDPPLLFKTLHNIGSLVASNVFGAIGTPWKATGVARSKADTSGGVGMAVRPLSSDEQGEAEQRAFAAALASGKAATVLEFYSPRCRLCSSLLDLVLEMERRNTDWLSFALADAENQKWLPEVVHYDIKYVPCFVLLDKHGRALAKTGVPTSRQHVIAGLSHLLKLQRPQECKDDDENLRSYSEKMNVK